MPAGVTNTHAAARSERATSEPSRTRGVLSLDDESSVDVSQADSTINISPEHCQHVPPSDSFILGGDYE